VTPFPGHDRILEEEYGKVPGIPGSPAEHDIVYVTRTTLVEFRNSVAKTIRFARRRVRSRPLPQRPFSNMVEDMQVHFTPEQEARLAQIATNAGTDAERLVKEAALRLLEEEAPAPVLPAGSVVAEMRALRARVKPDPEGRTTRDYVQHGRR